MQSLFPLLVDDGLKLRVVRLLRFFPLSHRIGTSETCLPGRGGASHTMGGALRGSAEG